MATELERGHEHAHGILLVSAEAVSVIVQHLMQVERQLWSMLRRGHKQKKCRQKY